MPSLAPKTPAFEDSRGLSSAAIWEPIVWLTRRDATILNFVIVVGEEILANRFQGAVDDPVHVIAVSTKTLSGVISVTQSLNVQQGRMGARVLVLGLNWS